MHEKNARTLALLIRLCDDLAWGRPADEDALFALTREGSSSPDLERLAEAFGMMIVKVEAREFHRAELLEKVEVGKGYQVTVHVKLTYKQFLKLSQTSKNDEIPLTNATDENVA